jgi:hypothetical protein
MKKTGKNVTEINQIKTKNNTGSLEQSMNHTKGATL